ncbi:MAG: hypothetical protein ACK5QG_16490, partial [Bacteroidota bacterium]
IITWKLLVDDSCAGVFDQAVDPKVKFKLHHKLRVDYILSRHPLDWLAGGLELQTPFFYLYRNPTVRK